MLYQWVLIAHLLGAAIWTGGHLVLCLRVLPVAWKTKDLSLVHQFESRYEGIGLPALLLQVCTGLWLAYRFVPQPSRWISFDSYLTTHIFIKLTLLFLTLGLAIHARLYLIPKEGDTHFGLLALHIIGVTVLSVLFFVVGVGFRTGGVF
ncbi:MAG: copper resistance protein CopD [Deltaproteobacteria bacterium]|nr:MAG: copper resistance protein CopD [Deltaproteobacteria bacterium]